MTEPNMSGAGEAQGRKAAAVTNASPAGRSDQTMSWEDALDARMVAAAMQILEERGLILKPFPNEPLRPFDHIILSAVHELQGEGYAVNIAGKASGMLGSEVLLGDTFGSLERLERQGLVMARVEDPAECEGVTRRYFAATLSGEHALALAPAAAKAVTGLLGDYA
jgi:hypothetical protein